MKYDVSSLPDNTDELKCIIAALQSSNETLENKYHTLVKEHSHLEKKHISFEGKYLSLEEELSHLEEKYKILQRKFFGRSSEKLAVFDELQGVLFNEIETGAVKESEEEIIEQGQLFETTTVKEHARKKPGRKALPSDLPREEVLHDLSEKEKQCQCCCAERKKIGQEITEELVIIPQRIFVRTHVYPKYGPCSCDEFLVSGESEIKKAPTEKRLIPGSIASAEFLAYVTTSKFVDALPFYRQEKIFERIGVDISRATLCNLMIEAHKKMTPFLDIFKETLKSGNFIRMDETTIQVLHEEGRKPESLSYMWVALGYPARGRPLVLYEYHPSRSGDIPCDLLDGFSGYLQTDGYDGYNKVVTRNGLIHVGCFAHVRRHFFDAAKVNKKDSRAHKALSYIRRIYEIESSLQGKELSDDEFVRQRKSSALPVLNGFHAWLVKTNDEILPKSSTGKAVRYALNEWSKLIRYLDEAFLTPDNNAAENAIRPFVVGRKNWLFSNTPRGAHASAVMYSLVESAKANKLEPYAYLRFLFDQLPKAADNPAALRALLPCAVSHDQLVRR